MELPALDILVGNLSGGMQRLVSFACAVIHDPQVVILDEPTTGLDILRANRVWAYLKKMTDRGATVFVSSHVIEGARDADRVAFMRAGRVLAEGDPEFLIERYAADSLEAVFKSLCLFDEDTYTPIVRYNIAKKPQEGQLLRSGKYLDEELFEVYNSTEDSSDCQNRKKRRNR